MMMAIFKHTDSLGEKNNIKENSHYHCINITEKYRDSHNIEKIVKTLKKA